MTLRVDKDYFIKRATKIYEYWNSDVDLSAVNSFVFMVGNSAEDIQYSKSHSLQTWLFNCSLPDTLLLLTKTGIYFLGSERKAQFFSPLETKENLHPIVPPFTTLNRNKVDKDKANFDEIIGVATKEGKSCGFFAKDKANSDFSKSWEAVLKVKNLSHVDISLFFARLFAVKDEKEIELMKKSAEASINAWGYLRKKIVEIVDTEKKIRHNKLSDELEKSMLAVQVQGHLAKTNALEICYTPIIQSGEQCALKFSMQSNEKLLHYGSVTSSLGARYFFYCSNVGRSMMVMPTALVEELYELLLTTEGEIISTLKPGSRMCDAFEAGVRHFTAKKPAYSQYLVKTSFGFVTGIEFREGLLLINEKCKQTVENNMTFIVALGLQNFPNPTAKDESGKIASLFLSDTVLVCDNGPNEILTERAKSRLRSNIIRFREPDASTANIPEQSSNQRRTQRSVVLQDQTRHKQTNEEKRKEHQKELADSLNEEARQRLSTAPGSTDTLKTKKSNISYKNDEKFPDDPEVERLMIFVDKRHDTVIVPIFGVPVPFHISMIKNASQTVEGDYTFLRINFTHPGSQIGKDNVLFPNPLAKFLKELTFKSSNVREPGETNPPSANLSTALRLIKEMQKRFRTMEAEEREKEGAVKQDKLILSTGKGNARLKDLYVRPNIIAKRISGALEAHLNGFRYTSLRGDKIDVLYNNIKHAFFQPCDNEMIILLHFHLKNPVLWGKKKYSDVQFYTEVGEITTDLNKYHHMQDRDDIQSEQMERDMRKKLNLAFQNFCDKVVRLTNEAVDFDTPFSELGFIGVPFRSSVTLKPTSSCLVNMTEWPPFVITLEEVELVHFERVTSNTKSFDMVIVFKDYHKKTQQVGHIPSSSLDSIKDWLNSCDIRYSEGPMSLNWNNIMKTITEDPEAFFEGGGWNFILKESDGEEEEDESEESSFAPSDDGDSDASDEDDDEEASVEASDDDDESEGDLESDESEGKDWSDLEEEAAKADKDKEKEGIVREDDRKRKGRGPAPSAKRRR